MKLTFRTLEYQNFMSVGNTPIKISLDSDKTTLICGANGSGKTTVMSALCFALFGRGYGDINKSALVNSINLKHTLATVEFDIGKKKFKIVRGIKPNIFEIYENDVLVNQDPSIKDYQKVLEQQILKFNYRAFTQVVAVGGGDDYIPFMKLAAKDRREFVEDLLDIRVFSTMNSIIKDQSKELKDELKFVTNILKSTKDKMVLQDSFIKKLKKEKSQSSDKIMLNITHMQNINITAQKQVDDLMITLKENKVLVDASEVMEEKLSEVRLNVRQIKKQIETKCQHKDSYNAMSTCPTCYQNVETHHKENIVTQYEVDISSFEDDLDNLAIEEAAAKKLISEYSTALELYSITQRKISDLNREIYSNNSSIKNLNEQVSEMEGDTSSIDDETDKLREFAKEYLDADKKKKEIMDKQQYQELVQTILSDSGIKSKIIKQYIPTINKLLNKYLADLDFFVSFHLDEQFNETIKSRHRDTFTYNNFSEGQKRRIDLAILLCWVEIAKAKNALHTNIAFFDEVDAPLDAAGSEMLHAALKASSSENVFIISHKSDQLADKVDNIIQFEIKNNFTQLVI